MKAVTIVLVLALTGCVWFKPQVQADFYEHSDGSLLVCIPGTKPASAGWRSVGDGKTTDTPIDCSDL